MADTRCPDCGSPVSPGAMVCPQCGFPLRPASIGRAGGPGRGVILAIAGAALVLLVGFGVVMAIVGPMVQRFTAEANQQQAITLLKWAYAREQLYHGEHRMYSNDPDRFAGDGPRPDRLPFALYSLSVSAASDRALCLEAVPTRRAPRGTPPLSMDAEGNLYHAAGCTGEFDAAVGVPGSTGDEGALEILHEVHRGVVEYHQAHGEYPRQVGDMVRRVSLTAAMDEFELGVKRADGKSLCVTLLPKRREPGRTAWALDHDGKVYEGDACAGTPYDHFATESEAKALADTLS